MIEYISLQMRSLNFRTLLNNLKFNVFPLLSFYAYLLLFARENYSYYIGLSVTFLFCFFMAAISSPWMDLIKETSTTMRLLVFLNSFGISYSTWHLLKAYPFIWDGSPNMLRFTCMILSIPAVYILNLLLWKNLMPFIHDIIGRAQIDKKEILIYVLMYALIAALLSFCYCRSQAFYGTKYLNDVIYTSDSPKLFKADAFVLINYVENDIRQPLFGILASPLMGIPCLLSTFVSNPVKALLIGYAQVALLFFSNLLLAAEMNLNRIQRVCFLLLFSCSYSCILFSVMIEQYIIAYFWLILSICLICENRKESRLTICAAGGTLITSLAYTPFTYMKSIMKNFCQWITHMVCVGIEFLLLIILFGRTDVLIDIQYDISVLKSFTGEKVGLYGKVLQFISFVRGCFVAPPSGPSFTEWPSWQLDEVVSISIIGSIIIVLIVLALVIIPKSKFVYCASFWICFSIFVLIVVGWGTSENGLILYSLYFGWAYIVVLYKLILHIAEKTKCAWIIPTVSVVIGAVMLFINLSAIKDMMDFVSLYYPI